MKEDHPRSNEAQQAPPRYEDAVVGVQGETLSQIDELPTFAEATKNEGS